MPYDISKRDGKYAVIKRDDGSVIGTHDTKGKARKQIAAIYFHERKPWTHR